MLYAIVVVLLLIADQGLKYWVTVHVALNEGRHVLIPKVLDVMNIHNYGIAFSWLQNVPSWVFALIAALFAVVVILALRRGAIHGAFGRWMAVLALAGAIGNCIDRVLSGYVVDMLAFAFWKSFPVFNLADACLVIGGIAFCLYVIFHKEEPAAEHPHTKRQNAAAPQRPAARRQNAAAPAKKPAVQQRSKAESVKAPAEEKPAAEKPSIGAVLAEKRAALQNAAAAHIEKRKEADARRAAEQERKAAEQPKPVAEDDPFAAWDRAVSEQDARSKAEQERKAAREAQIRANREARRKAEAAAAAASAPAEEKPAAPAAPAKTPAVDSAPTRKVAVKKIEEMAAKLAAKKPAEQPAPAAAKPVEAPAPKAEEEVSYDLEDILAEFRDL